ncbi:MAG: AAA family ATPase [Methylocella sp.]
MNVPLLDHDPPYEPPGAHGQVKFIDGAVPPRFQLIPFDQIKFDEEEEWLVKKLLPKRGVAAFYGRQSTFKSFGAMDCGLHVAIGWNWAGRRVTQAPVVYIAAEGAAGVRKRKIGFELQHAEYLPKHVPFYMIPAAPNLGVGQDDLNALIAATEMCGIAPGLIIVDTLSQTLGGAEENGAGMQQFIANAQALAECFGCLVLVVHHSGLSDTDRPRGHSSLACALDALVHFERKEGTKSSVMTVQKLKDEEDEGVALELRMALIVIGKDSDGDEISTLIVESIEATTPVKTLKAPSAMSKGQKLLMDVITQAIDEAGVSFNPGDGRPIVSAVSDTIARERYYGRIAEPADAMEDQDSIADKRRNYWNRYVKAALNAKLLLAAQRTGERYFWKP